MKVKQLRLILQHASKLYQKAGDAELADTIQRLSEALASADNKEVAVLAKALSAFRQFK